MTKRVFTTQQLIDSGHTSLNKLTETSMVAARVAIEDGMSRDDVLTVFQQLLGQMAAHGFKVGMETAGSILINNRD